jgi:hypothetical protein
VNGNNMNTYEFNTPAAINGEQLKNELQAEDVYIREDKLVIISELPINEVEQIIALHNPIPLPEPTVAEKLASVGLSIEELKAALGSN